MFSKGNKSETKNDGGSNRSLTVPKLTSPGVAPSIVSANLRVTGDLESEGDIQIDGAVEGDVRSSSVTVGEHAIVSGAIVAAAVHVAGTVKGQINGKQVELARTAKVTGDIVHESLAIEAGAFIQGLCRHVDVSGQNGDPAAKDDGDKAAKDNQAPNLVYENEKEQAKKDDDAKGRSGVAATAAKSQEAVKKVFR